MPPDKQAEVALTAARKAYNDGNLPFAAERFQEVLAKFDVRVAFLNLGAAKVAVAGPMPLTFTAAEGVAFAKAAADAVIVPLH